MMQALIALHVGQVAKGRRGHSSSASRPWPLGRFGLLARAFQGYCNHVNEQTELPRRLPRGRRLDGITASRFGAQGP